MIVSISWGTIAIFLTFIGLIAPAVYFMGRLSVRVDTIEKETEERGALVPRFYIVESSVEVLKEGQRTMILELKAIRSNFDRFVGRFEEGEDRLAKLEEH